MTYKPFSVIVVPFPFTDNKNSKKRPAVVISKEVFQKKTEHICLLMITTAKHSSWYGDHMILDLGACGLSTPSIVRQKAFTIDMRLIEKEIGQLSAHDIKEVLKCLAQNLNV